VQLRRDRRPGAATTLPDEVLTPYTVEAVELVGKPFDLEEILGRVQQAVAAIDRGTTT
jgi:hypothetical protein